MKLYAGVVEDRNDPLEIGRYRVRVFGIHSHLLSEVPTKSLPWANVLQPVTSAAAGGISETPGLVVGSSVIVTYTDDDMQKPLILGSIAGLQPTSSLVINGQEVPKTADVGFQNYTNDDYKGQSDISKLARSGKTDSLRESAQINNIPGAFSEPPDLRPFRQYPYNKVRQTESGHIQEFDDTPGNERVTTQHKSGTFTEMRPDGDNVTKVIKDNYTLIAGDNNLYVAGNVNILVQGDVNLTTQGDYNLNVGGDYNVRVQGNTFEHTNSDKTEIVNGNRSGYYVSDFDVTIGGDSVSTVVGSDTSSIYGDVVQNSFGSFSSVVGGLFDQSVNGDITISSKANTNILSSGVVEVSGTEAAYMRGATVDLNDTSPTSVSFEDLDEDSKIEVYEQDFESIEADISVTTTDATIKSTQYGSVDSETFINNARRTTSIDSTQQQSTILNGKGQSKPASTAPVFFPGEGRKESTRSNVWYNFSSETTRNGEVDQSLISILSSAAKAAGIYQVEIYSGAQPGSSGGRVGSGRHDTGFAADIRLIATEEDYNNQKGIIYAGSDTSTGQAIIEKFMKFAVANGIKGAGHSHGYLGDYGIHVDTLGRLIVDSKNPAAKTTSGYNREILAAWKSTYWFRMAMLSGDSSYKYYIALESGTRYYSKTSKGYIKIT